MGSARINAIRQRLGLRADTFRKTVSGPAVNDIGKFKSKQKTDKVIDLFENKPILEPRDAAEEEHALSVNTNKIPKSRVEGTFVEEGGNMGLGNESELSMNLGIRDYKHQAPHAVITKSKAEKWAKSARIQTARQRLADIFDVIEGGGKIKPTKFVESRDEWGPIKDRLNVDVNRPSRLEETKTTPAKFLDIAARGWKDTDPKAKHLDFDEGKEERKWFEIQESEPNFEREIFRGDELGDVEYYKRKLRRGDPIPKPALTKVNDKAVDHEGRRRTRALYEEGVKEIPVDIEYDPATGTTGGMPTISEDEVYDTHIVKGKPKGNRSRAEEYRRKKKSPIGLGKSARIQIARQRLADIFDVIEGGSVERIKRQPNLYLKNGVRISPRRFLDLASSSGLEETSKRLDPKRWEHNLGIFSDLGDEYTGDPSVESMTPTTSAIWHEGEQYRMPKKFYINKDKEGRYTDEFHKYFDHPLEGEEGYYMTGVDERDFIDADTPPITDEGKPLDSWKAYQGLPQKGDTRNKILGSGEDATDGYAAHPDHEIFRGDETGGTVEYFRRLLRRGEGFERPQLNIDTGGNVTSHEGRHRARAMFDEDVKDFPMGGDINVGERSEGSKKIPLSKIKGERGSIDRKRADLKVNEELTGNKITIPRKDKRYPILGRYSKSARIQMARERLGAVGKTNRILKDDEERKISHSSIGSKAEIDENKALDEGKVSFPKVYHADDKDTQKYYFDPAAAERWAKLRQRLGMMIDGKWIDDAEVMANPKKYGLKPFKRDKPFKWNPPKDPEHEAWVKEQYDNFDKVVGDIKAHNEDVKTEKESYESSVIRKPRKHRPKKPTQQDRIDVMEARLRQRIAEIGRPKQFNFKETLNKHWKLAAKDPRFKAFTHSSSFVGNVKYDQDEQSMEIILNGKTYDFCNVEERLFDSFSGAGSKGAFFNREIKSLHNCGAW